VYFTSLPLRNHCALLVLECERRKKEKLMQIKITVSKAIINMALKRKEKERKKEDSINMLY
jgi:hypothetical protein